MFNSSYNVSCRALGRFILLSAVTSTIVSCSNSGDNSSVHYPSEHYEYVSSRSANATFSSKIYVPIYSHVYLRNGTRPINLAATLSIRSIDARDSIFVSGVDYYNSQGKLIKQYLDKTLLLKPMHSAEFIVEENNTEGGAGAHFIINCSATKSTDNLLVQAVMVSQESSLGLTFKTDGIKLNDR